NGTANPFANVAARPVAADPGRTVNTGLLRDIDNDGKLDLILGTTGQNRLYFGDGTGGFAAGVDIAAVAETTQALAVGDLNGDSIPDLVVGNDGQNRVYRHAPPRTFTVVPNPNLAANNTRALLLVDVNGDSRLDLVAGNNTINLLYLGNGDATFQVARNLGQPAEAKDTNPTYALAFGDVNEDGFVDLVAGNHGGVNRLYLNDSTQPGTFAAGRDISPDNLTTNAIVLIDLNGDGHLDVVAGNEDVNRVYLGDGKGDFSAGTDLSADPETTLSLAVANLNGDQHPDIIAGNIGPNRLYFNSGTADRFSAPSGLPHGTATALLTVLDDQKNYVADLVGMVSAGAGAYFDANTISVEATDSKQELLVELGSTDPALWAALPGGSGFSLTVGGVRKVITPILNAVTSMADLATAIQAQLNDPAQGFGPGRVEARIEGNVALFKNISGNFARVEGLGDPGGVAGSMVGPRTPGIYKSVDHGRTWRPTGGPGWVGGEAG